MNAQRQKVVRPKTKPVNVDETYHEALSGFCQRTGFKIYAAANEAMELFFKKHGISPKPAQPESK